MVEKEKILVVDDEPSIRKYLQTLLEVDGYDVETVPGGKEALEKVGAGLRPHFIILDVLMPEIDGLELRKRLRQKPELSSLVIVMVTTETELSQMTAALEAGANEYIMKPFTRDILVEKLELVGIQSLTTKA